MASATSDHIVAAKGHRCDLASQGMGNWWTSLRVLCENELKGDLTKYFIFVRVNFSFYNTVVTLQLHSNPNPHIYAYFVSQFDEISHSTIISRNFEQFNAVAQCGNLWNLLSHIFCKNFVKITDLLKKLLKELIWRIFFPMIVNFSFFHTVSSWALTYL